MRLHKLQIAQNDDFRLLTVVREKLAKAVSNRDLVDCEHAEKEIRDRMTTRIRFAESRGIRIG